MSAGWPPLVLASRNTGKLREFRRLLAPYPWTLVSLDEAGFTADLAEPGPGYSENAGHKAEAVSLATGHAAIGDDSGIEALGLDGWPGPASARWLGPDADDRDRLLGLLAEVDTRGGGERRCRYVAAVALSRTGSDTVVAHGTCDGTLVTPGGAAGFGYDPGFFSADLGIRFAEASPEAKDRVSHRARAIAELARIGALGTAAGGP